MEKGGALGMAARMDTSEPGAFGGEAGAYPPPPPIPGGGGGGGRADSDMEDASPGRGGGGRGEREAPREDETREERESRKKRDEIREERRRERERERRLEAKDAHGTKKSKLTRDRDRDIGEKVALGMAKVGGGEVMYDQRLFNQDQGMNSGFAAEDAYGVYDKALFTDRTAAGALYRPKALDDDGGDEGAKGTDKFKPDKGFKGADVSAGPRSAPVQFERNAQGAPPAAEEADPFGLDQFLSEVKADKGRGKNTLEKIGDGRGGMKAAGGGGSSYDDLSQGGSGRRMEFAKEKGGR
jgi:SNW domain-containing protein 1